MARTSVFQMQGGTGWEGYETPSDDDIARATEFCNHKTPRIVAYSPEMSREHLTSRNLTATLIEPFPDSNVEERLTELAQRDVKEEKQ